MICNHCGYCCIHNDVLILVNPDLGIVEDNLKHKPAGIKCSHLIGTAPFEYRCGIHEHPNYKLTPCNDFDQVASAPETPCRIGSFLFNQGNTQRLSETCDD